jgi:glucokinase
MLSLGVELQDARAIAVAVDERGDVRARASVDDANLEAAAHAAVDRAAVGPGSAPSLGVSAVSADSPSIAPVLASLARRFAGIFTEDRAISSGAAAAVAEAWIGAAKGADDIALLAVGDHVTAGILHRGAPLLGAHGRAVSIAWLGLNPVEREDYRRVGCLEAEVAASGVVRRLIWRIKAGDQSRVQEEVANDLSAITIDHVLDAARHGDGVSISVVRDTAKYLGMAAANLVVLADPAVVVLGGIMASAADLLLEPVRAEIARRLPRAMIDTLAIVPAALGVDAAAIGAARLGSAAPR